MLLKESVPLPDLGFEPEQSEAERFETFVRRNVNQSAALAKRILGGGWASPHLAPVLSRAFREAWRDPNPTRQLQISVARCALNALPPAKSPGTRAAAGGGATFRMLCEHLSARLRGAFILHDGAGLSLGEVASVLALSKSKVRQQLHEARHTLRGLREHAA